MNGNRDLTELTGEECLRLLGEARIGRVVFNESALPAIQPVNFALDDRQIIFRTAGGAKLAAALRRSVAAFEVDEIDPSTWTGWSVVAIGRTHEITDPARLAVLSETMPEPWAPDRTAHIIAISIEIITGRQLKVADGINKDLLGFGR
ncbi:pyridoxamine 5'-phosphate oxidase family protein [Pseudonocardia acaciae]|uniref:pyridoxamine 5'-phosphate oxidase family protein n=1 Tax=Pseudonocardia acaciae TaxID=551276 RepID=UPI00048F35F1|nr:pyridoxamine 5'-phosphate oxidase family protein [Pseudonocardia acaciae]